MPRPDQVPPCPEVPPQAPKPWIEQKFEIELITPMFGGGAEAGKPDEDFPIRPTAIRGQLEFWWRATAGARCQSVADLRKRQSEVWGSTEAASEVVVRVDDVKCQAPLPCAEYEPDKNNREKLRRTPKWHPTFAGTHLPYALFPFQGKLSDDKTAVEDEPARFIPGGRFRLVLRYPKELQQDVAMALWAWSNFGGLGSRTRRGVGALYSPAFAPSKPEELRSQIKAQILQNRQVRDWPTFAQSALVGPAFENPLDAWNDLMENYRYFRQGEGFARNPGQDGRPGRSRWPEPETIRRITGRRERKHSRMKNIPENAFPRADLGLPIVFHFKDRDDPNDVILYPERDRDGEKRYRMASAIIFRSVRTKDGKALPVVIVLRTKPLSGVDLRKKSETSLPLPNDVVIRDPSLSRYPNSPLAKSQHGSALEALVELFKEKKYQPV